MQRLRFPIAGKFAVMPAVLVAALAAVGFAGLRGLGDLRGNAASLYQDTATLQQTAALANDSNQAAKVALQIVLTRDQATITRLQDQLRTTIGPQVDADINTLRVTHARDPLAERAALEQVAALWARFTVLQQSNGLGSTRVGRSAQRSDDALAREVQAIFDPIGQRTRGLVMVERRSAASSSAKASASYQSSRSLMILTALGAILAGCAVVALLVRAVVPRVRRYSDFASQVAAEQATSGVEVSGRDELTELGMALNEMVRRRIAQRSQEAAQAEFAEVMQLTETEEEAHHLLKRQLERSIPEGVVAVLNRNNSADRLQATTPLAPDSLLATRLTLAKPRSCLAVRFARTHVDDMDRDALLSCELCGKLAEQVTCEPLLVSGEVIGSVMAAHPQPLSDSQARGFKDSVAQAAPVLANLRNLAIAEMRAATDSLTGLPNNRAVQDTLKRMVAHAARSDAPLGAILLDIDHFKQINDTCGHGRGDDVLAAVGTTLQANIRASDFAGRYGGEEFIVLLPDTDRVGALTSAQKLREAIAKITVPGVEQAITASLGVAILPLDAADAATLIRNADRALYTAKNNGRNRVESAESLLFALDSGAASEEPAPT